MVDRRQFLGSLVVPAVAAGAALLDPTRLGAAGDAASEATAPAEDLAGDESFWLEIRSAFSVDRSLLYLNNGGVSPSPMLVQEAMRRHLADSNSAPSHTLWNVQTPQRETVRARLADAFGCDAEEIAITRNASEGLQIVQQGFDLQPGDEVLTSTQDYPRMITTFEQRARRDGIVLRQVRLPTPAEDPAVVVRRFARAITPRTKLILACHVVNLTGQILPIRDLVAMARDRGVPVLVDGAHGFAHLPFQHADLDCDYYATSLHKWLFGPHGTGMLYVRRSKIGGLWPMMAAPARLDADIRKFEEIGTHPMASTLAIAEALTFHETIGAARKLARLRYLGDRWRARINSVADARWYTSDNPRYAAGMRTVGFGGVNGTRLARRLWNRHQILVAAIQHPEVNGIRVSPSVYTTLNEIDHFADTLASTVRDLRARMPISGSARS